MKTRTQIDVAGDYQMATWKAEGGQERCWGALREQAQSAAAGRGQVLDDEAETRHVLFMRILARNGFDSVSAECAREDAMFVRLQLSCWAESR